MSRWSARRRLSYILIILIMIAIFVGWRIYSNRPTPDCFDGIMNQDELGVDCGGSCAKVCEIETTNLVTIWSRAFKVSDSRYTAVAFIENPNIFGIENVSYRFKLYDSQNVLIKEREGSTFVNPDERFVIVENNIEVGNRDPSLAILEITGQSEWVRFDGSEPNRLNLSIREKALTLRPVPKLTATILNNALEPVSDIEVVGVVYDDNNNAIGASTTFIDSLETDERTNIFFTWPEQFEGVPSVFEVYPRINRVSSS